MPFSTPPAPAHRDKVELSPWQAELQLGFARRGEHSVAVLKRHHGPLRVQRLLYPEGPACCHALLLHPPGGIAGHDRLRIDIQVQPGAHALLTTPGASKWYRSVYGRASQTVNLEVAGQACLEWLPQESLLFDGAHAEQHLCLRLAPEATCFGWELCQLGRLAAGERWQDGSLRQSWRIYRGETLVWLERADWSTNSPLRDSSLGLAGHHLFATLWLASPRLEAAPQAALDAARACIDELPLPAGASWLPAPANLLLARALSHDEIQLRALCERWWQALRPWICDLPPRRPRIWNT